MQLQLMHGHVLFVCVQTAQMLGRGDEPCIGYLVGTCSIALDGETTFHECIGSPASCALFVVDIRAPSIVGWFSGLAGHGRIRDTALSRV